MMKTIDAVAKELGISIKTIVAIIVGVPIYCILT
ncbi:hypothetical protein PSBY109024_00280 [Pseudoalteromonas byunsanensis]